MTPERTNPQLPDEPPPLSNDVQKVTVYDNGGGWKAVIECPGDKNDCDKDHKFSGLTAGINEQRRQIHFHNKGIH